MPVGLKREVSEVVATRGERAAPMSAANRAVPAALADLRRHQRVGLHRLAAGREALGAGSDSSARPQRRVLGPKETQTPRLDILVGRG